MLILWTPVLKTAITPLPSLKQAWDVHLPLLMLWLEKMKGILLWLPQPYLLPIADLHIILRRLMARF